MEIHATRVRESRCQVNLISSIPSLYMNDQVINVGKLERRLEHVFHLRDIQVAGLYLVFLYDHNDYNVICVAHISLF